MLSLTGRGLRGYWVHALTSSREIYNSITALCHWWCEKGYELSNTKNVISKRFRREELCPRHCKSIPVFWWWWDDSKLMNNFFLFDGYQKVQNKQQCYGYSFLLASSFLLNRFIDLQCMYRIDLWPVIFTWQNETLKYNLIIFIKFIQ